MHRMIICKTSGRERQEPLDKVRYNYGYYDRRYNGS